MYRLNKFLQANGVSSRRGSEELIFAGRVRVNGTSVLKPEERVTDKDSVTVDGKLLKKFEKKRYFLLNKPRGFLCTHTRVGKEKIVPDLFENFKERLFTVGRLDKETTGLLIVTNDGTFANQVMHPSFGIQKEYLVKTDNEITYEHLLKIQAGTRIEGVHVKPKKVIKMRRNTLKIVVGEGKKHEVRCLVNAADLQVLELCRIRIGNLHLGKLPKGAYRSLTQNEIEGLQP